MGAIIQFFEDFITAGGNVVNWFITPIDLSGPLSSIGIPTSLLENIPFFDVLFTPLSLLGFSSLIVIFCVALVKWFIGILP